MYEIFRRLLALGDDGGDERYDLYGELLTELSLPPWQWPPVLSPDATLTTDWAPAARALYAQLEAALDAQDEG